MTRKEKTKQAKKEFRAPRGTSDYLPDKASLLHYLDSRAAALFADYGYRRIITPTFEATDLFKRSIGASSDIVRKEMYTFSDRAGRSLTLRPEATAPVVRAYIEHNLKAASKPVKLYYMGPMYRYERPQSGRYREFWQLGVEAFGSSRPIMDAEVISLMMEYLRSVGLRELVLHLGSMGDSQCRPAYVAELRRSLAKRAAAFCPDCQTRLKINPLRVFDCKNTTCRALLAEAPKIIDYLCPECDRHFQQLRAFLTKAGWSYRVDPTLVRGFDYYTRTTFEVRSSLLGAQNALGGGGRYDNLIADYGGPETPAVGFALGVERIMLCMETEGIVPKVKVDVDAYIALVDENNTEVAFELLSQLRRQGLAVEMDMMGRSLRAQLKTADKLGAVYAVIIGPDEVAAGRATVRHMADAAENKVKFAELAAYIGAGKSE